MLLTLIKSFAKHLGATENTFKQQEYQTNKTATNPTSNRRIQHRRHQKESTGQKKLTSQLMQKQLTLLQHKV